MTNRINIGPYLQAISSPDMPEEVSELSVLRTLHSVSARTWTGRNERALWAEWSHPLEGSRPLSAIIDGLRSFHWERFIAPGSVAIDIGGHSGDTAIPLALFAFDSVANTKGTVIVVEPNPAVVPILQLNLTFNTHLANFYLVAAAMTRDDVASITLADYGSAGCNGGVLESGLSAPVAAHIRAVAGIEYNTKGVSMATLLAEIGRHVTSRPAGFIKIDCEGYDKEILRPCRELFATSRPTLFIEWFAWFTPEDDADLFAVIDSIDYVAYEPVTLLPAVPARRVPDLLCFHKNAAQPSL